LADAPATAEVAPERSCIVALDGERRRAGEAVAREQRRSEAGVRAPARTVLHHRRGVADAQYLATRPEIFGDTQRVPGCRLVKREMPRCDCRTTNRIPRTGAVIVRHRRVQRDSRTRGDLVAEHDA